MESQKGTFSCQCCYEPYDTEYRIFPSDGGVDLYQNLCDECEDLYYNHYDDFEELQREMFKKRKLKRRNDRINKILSNE